MMFQEIPPRNEARTLATLTALYPLAFAMANASNSRTSLALQRRRLARPNIPRGSEERSLKTPVTVLVGLHPMAKCPPKA
jgi:hypothetical protein